MAGHAALWVMACRLALSLANGTGPAGTGAVFSGMPLQQQLPSAEPALEAAHAWLPQEGTWQRLPAACLQLPQHTAAAGGCCCCNVATAADGKAADATVASAAPAADGICWPCCWPCC